MPRPFLGLCTIVVGMLCAILNRPLAEMGVDVRDRMLNWPPIPARFARAMLVVGGLAFSLVGLMVLLGRW